MISIYLWFIILILTIYLLFRKLLNIYKKRMDLLIKKKSDGNSLTDNNLKELKGPISLPIIGCLHLLRGPDRPFEIFTKLSKKYGDIYEIKLGVANCVVVSSYDLVKEVLITKGHHFGGRPDFLRFHHLFGGDRNNSLALCDWSDLQRTRRSLARSFCAPRGGSLQLEELSKIAVEEVSQLLNELNKTNNSMILNGIKSLKPLLLGTLANMFTRYMCSIRFNYNDEEFIKIVRSFDEIFWDINQGYAVDFLPWLRPFYSNILNKLNGWSTDIRNFILRRIIYKHRDQLDTIDGVPKDFTDALLLHLESPQSGLSWDHIMFELEDFLGGHSAIGNLVMLVLAYVAITPGVQSKIQNECQLIMKKQSTSSSCDKFITLNDRDDMPYTNAVIWETLRISSSPIVPHVSTIDTDIDGYFVKKNTVIFINNFELNLGKSYWGDNSRDFYPERFLKCDNNGNTRVIKPDYFVPFSTGKRTCIGQKLVQGFAFVIISALLSRYNVYPTDYYYLKKQLVPGSVAVPPDPFNLVFKPIKQ